MKNIIDYLAFKLGIAFLILIAGALTISAQSSTFTYQGKLSDNGVTANGSYDIEFRLFDAAAGGSALAAQQRNSVAVADGMFAVALDFGGAAFNGAARYIEIAVRPAGAGSFTTMSPRSAISSTPYAIRSSTADIAINSWQLGGVSAGSFVQTSDSRLSDARQPAPGSGNYIQSNPLAPQPGDFHIAGTGTADGGLSANIVTATSQFNLAGLRMTWADTYGNTAVGKYSGGAITPVPATGQGFANSFFGLSAGYSNTHGRENAFLGFRAGLSNTTGGKNSFVGSDAGYANTTGNYNSFFGNNAGMENLVGAFNSFVGQGAGYHNNGNNNTLIGWVSGDTNTTGSDLTLIGAESDVASSGLTNAVAIGAKSLVSQSNSIVLGSIYGVNGATQNVNVGIGTTAPKSKLHILERAGNVHLAAGCSDGFGAIGFGPTLDCGNYSMVGDGLHTIINRATGGGIIFRENNQTQVVIGAGGVVTINGLGSAGSTQLCRNASNQISTCSSSLRYKKDLQKFTGGLSLVNELNPITFRWKSDNKLDVGFGAEDVAKVEPLLASYNDKGEVEGVKYDRISAVLVNAIKDQQGIIDRQQTEIDALKQLVCRKNKKATECRGK